MRKRAPSSSGTHDRHRSWLRAAGLLPVLATGAALLAAAPASAVPAAPHEPAAPVSTVSMTVRTSDPGHALPQGFEGLSMEATTLTNNEFSVGNLLSYLRLLGPHGVLRIGGNSTDKTFWTSSGEPNPSWSEGRITPASLVPLARLLAASHWKAILGVNLKQKDVARAVNEVEYAHRILGPSLLGIEIGNEPNYYYSSDSVFFQDFESYATAIRQAVPSVRLVGPDPGHEHPAFLAAFAAEEAALPRPDISVATNHHYPLSACGGNVTTIPELLGTASVNNETAAADAVVSAGQELGVPAIMDETNSVTCGGSPGVSDVFASSLWSLDYGLLLAHEGVTAAGFHGGIRGCGYYSPLCTQGSSPDLTAQPVFYGMMAVREVGTGHFVAVDNPDAANVRAYAVRHGSHLTMVLDNVQDPSGNGPTQVTVNLGSSFRQAAQTVLSTSSGDGLSARTGITLGGQTIGADGTLPPPAYTPVALHGDTLTVTVPAASASIIKLN